ncbi:MAG: BRCT domain-containing protein [Syntrophomonadaceae bacterium]
MSSGSYYREFGKFMFMSEVEKAFNTLEGLLKGIAIDGVISPEEINELNHWFNLYRDSLSFHSFSEMVDVISTALSDQYIDEEEKADILWLCSKYTSGDNPYYDLVASDVQRLQGILHGIMADNKIETREIELLEAWLDQNLHLTGVYPYDELCSLIGNFMKDGLLSAEEINFLKVFFAEFIDLKTSYNLNPAELSELRDAMNISGVCAIDPVISFTNKTFSFSGKSPLASRFEIKNKIESLGGRYETRVTGETDFLVVANEGSACWAFSCYGRKVEQAMKMRKAGHLIIIVQENDFWNAASGKALR